MTTCLPQIVRGNSACLISTSHAAAYQALIGKDWTTALPPSGVLHPDCIHHRVIPCNKQLKSAFYDIYVYITEESAHQASSSAKADGPVNTGDYGIAAFAGLTTFVVESPRLTSMPEMPDAGKHHGDPGVIGGFYHLIVADRAAGLDHRGSAGFDSDQQPIGERKEGVRRHHRAPCHGLGEFRLVGGILRLARGDARGIHPAHLAGADADGGEIPGVNDGVGFDMLGDA